MPEVLTQTVPSVQPKVPVQADNTTQQPSSKEDLISRASKVSLTPEGQVVPEAKFNVNDIEKITDPATKKLVEDAYKSFQADYTRKTQAIADEKRRLEEQAQTKWDANRIQSVLNDPTFIQAAQEYTAKATPPSANGNTSLTHEEEESLRVNYPEQFKAYRESIEAKNAATNALVEINRMKQQAAWEREDSQLKTRYANYDPQAVTQVFNDMMSGKVQASREHLFRVLDYESAVKRAYQLGKDDRKLEMGEKLSASSPTQTLSVTSSSSDVPVKLVNESHQDYFKRVSENAMRKLGVIK